MHRQLKTLLRSAAGDSRFVVVVFLDVRGFSSFAKMAESSESALFLKSAYTRILDNHFGKASFFKPTGDGLLVILDYSEESLSQVVQDAVDASIRLVDAFPTITADDPMVNFEVPGELGIGLSRGAATRLRSGEIVLDYSGRPLNLAARLMDIARPSGVVFSDSLGLDLLDPDTLQQFAADDVYVKGIAEDRPMSVHYLANRTVIADVYKRPLHQSHVHAEKAHEVSVRELEGMGHFRFPLTKEPLDRGAIKVVANFPDATPSGGKSKKYRSHTEVDAVYGEGATGPYAGSSMPALAATLKQKGAKSTWTGPVRVEYAVANE